MTRVTAETVEHVARLARLSLTPEERETFARQLDGVLAHAESIQALDEATRDVEPMSHAGAAAALREDVSRPGLSPEDVFGGAPDAKDGLFRVPRVLGG